VKKPARNGDVLGCDGRPEALVAGFDASRPLRDGNVPADLISLGRICGFTLTDSDEIDDDSAFWPPTKAVASFKMREGSGRVDGALTCRDARIAVSAATDFMDRDFGSLIALGDKGNDLSFLGG
jgi:hypothetical protein